MCNLKPPIFILFILLIIPSLYSLISAAQLADQQFDTDLEPGDNIDDGRAEGRAKRSYGGSSYGGYQRPEPPPRQHSPYGGGGGGNSYGGNGGGGYGYGGHWPQPPHQQYGGGYQDGHYGQQQHPHQWPPAAPNWPPLQPPGGPQQYYGFGHPPSPQYVPQQQYRPPMMPPGYVPPPPPCFPYPCIPPTLPPQQTPLPPAQTSVAPPSVAPPATGEFTASTAASGPTSSASDATSAGTPGTGGTTVSTTFPGGAGGLSQAQRNAVLAVHNSLRSDLARGAAQNQTGTMPTGTNILQLSYDTGLERTAESHADRCTFEHSDGAERNGSGENLFWTSNRTVDFAEVLVEASNWWWRELVQFGIQASLVLSTEEFNKGIGHWSQMAWRSTARLGCGVNVCSNATYVVCHYSPAGNVINEQVYQSGTPCTDCATAYSGSSCNATSSLCVLPG